MILIAFVFYLGICALIAMTGSNKAIGYWGVFFLSLFLSPLIGLIIGLASGSKTQPVPHSVNIYQNMPNQHLHTQQPHSSGQFQQPQVQQPVNQPPVQHTQSQQHTPHPEVAKYAQIEKLAEMKDKGILSEEEFQREKNRVLGV